MNEPGPPRDIVVVTGAARGIGRAISEKLAGQGMCVIALDVDADALAQLSLDGPDHVMLVGDVRDRDTLAGARAAAHEHGRLYGWVNNAGLVRLAPMHLMAADDIDLVVDVNLRAAIFGTQVALSSFIANEVPGVIVNMSSVHARSAFAGYSAYDATKAAIEALTRSTCMEYGHLGIRCNAVAPGAVDTGIVADLLDDPMAVADARRRVAQLSPMGRVSLPGEVAGVVAFLMSDDALSINGHVLTVDNGMTAGLVHPRPTSDDVWVSDR